MKRLGILILLAAFSFEFSMAATYPNKKVLVLVEGDYNIKSYATGQGRQMVQLLGHFNTTVTIKGVNAYKTHDIDQFDYLFYVGFSGANIAPSEFCNDILNTSKPVIWINSGFIDFCRKHKVEEKYGFKVTEYLSSSDFGYVRTNDNVVYIKGTTDINLIQIDDKGVVEVLATAFSIKPKKEVPYMVKSGNLYYVSDLPFTGATESDRYLFFADKLHDILGEDHPENHQAIIRIEDVTPLNDPDKLREVADILSERGIPFMVGVVPIYVNPGEEIRVKLTERPEVIDALKYMVQNGGSIVMHGVTHQYRGISTNDYEFWDGITNKPINGENSDDIEKKIESGLDEFIKNGIYPVAWETPHYTASNKTYEAVSKFFSSAVEQRMTIEDYDYGQYFPYIINKDIYGQKIFPENLGYVPLNPNYDTSLVYVNKIIKGSEMIHHVRDGIASCFFHPFLNLNLLKQLADGLKKEGYSFLDLRDYDNWVKTRDKIILTGSQSYSLTLDNSYLLEIYYDKAGNITKRIFSPERLNGQISKDISLQPGEFYMAEGIDYHIKEPTFKDKALQKFQDTYTELIGKNEWHEARVALCWNQFARGASFYDQASMAAMFASLNINVDTIFAGQDIDLEHINLLVVPNSYINFLTYFDFDKIIRFVKQGGNLITDRKNKLIEKFDIKFFNIESRIQQVRDNYFPQEFISWKYSQLVEKFDFNDDDEIFCEDANTRLPAAIGRKYGNGKIIFFNSMFDQNTPHGYSNFPFAMEYIRKYFHLQPVFKRENLEVYFDPGLRQNTSVENLVKIWVKQGIRIIHIGGWHQYPKYNYDYKRVIKLAHENGILVYAWFEPPYISQKFWEKHPEWREKNFKNEDVVSVWRYPVALTEPKCLETVISDYITFLKSEDWDGVNLAELHFEAGKGFEDAKLFSPMHPSACKEFKKKYGFDMRQIFDQSSDYYWKTNQKAKDEVIKYRVDKIYEFHDKILQYLTDYAKTKSGFNVMVTFLDTYFSPENIMYYGINSDKIIELQKKYNFILQPEDPSTKWSTDPARYVELGRTYSKKMNDSTKLSIDLNILSFRKKDEVTPFPTLLQTGIESYELINFSAESSPRFTIYSEATCNPQDLFAFSYASSEAVKYQYDENGYTVNSPYSFIMQLPENTKILNVDGQSMMGFRDNQFFIPAGNHIIKLEDNNLPGFSTVELQPHLLSFTGNVLNIKFDMRKLKFDYESTERALVSLNSNPTSISVDNRNYNFEVLKGNDCFSVFLPTGKHTVSISTGDKFTYGISLTSLWSISAIAIYGALATLALILMYFILKIVRRVME